MDQDRCIELAREAATSCGERHDYMPATELLASTWTPHRWVIDAMLSACMEAEGERDRYMNGNTELLGLWMKLFAGEDIIDVQERAREILISAGLMSVDHSLNWEALEARKPKQMTWSEAVTKLVTDPAERERLLAMDDKAPAA